MKDNSIIVAPSISWWGIGLSILAANFAYDYIHVGASMGYANGLAMGSYEWTGTLSMIVILLFVFPRILSTGVKTTPEYLGLRFGMFTRKTVAVVMIFIHIVVVMIPVLFSAAESLTKWYGLSYGVWLAICFVAITGVLLTNNLIVLMRMNILLIIIMIITGIVVMFYCFHLVGGISNFAQQGAPRINAFLPSDDTTLPWHSVVFGGLWVAHAFYWSFNPFIQQFILSSRTLSKAQFAFLLTATLKIVIPFIIMVPGITLFILKGEHYLENSELAFPVFITELIPPQVSGLILIVYLSTLLSIFSSIGFSGINLVLNDIIPASFKDVVDEKTLYRIILLLFMLVAFTGAYFFEPLGNTGLLHYNQVLMNAFTPTIVAVFGLGLFVKRITTLAANTALLTSIPLFLIIHYLYPSLVMMNTGGIVFLIESCLMIAMSFSFPQKIKHEVVMVKEIRFERHLLVITWSIILVTLVMSVYVILM